MKFHAMLLTVLFSIVSVGSLRGQEPTLFGINSDSAGLSTIDITNGNRTFIGPLSSDPNRFPTPTSMALIQSSQEIVTWSNTGSGRGLVSVDQSTGAGTLIGRFSSSDFFPIFGSLAANSSDELFGFSTSDGTLGNLNRIEIINGEAVVTRIGGMDIIPDRISGADFSQDGILYGLSLSQNKLYTVDVDSGELVDTVDLSTNIGLGWALAFDRSGALYGAGSFGPQGPILFNIDKETGEVFNINSVIGGGNFSPQGLAFVGIPEPSGTVAISLLLCFAYFRRKR